MTFPKMMFNKPHIYRKADPGVEVDIKSAVAKGAQVLSAFKKNTPDMKEDTATIFNMMSSPPGMYALGSGLITMKQAFALGMNFLKVLLTLDGLEALSLTVVHPSPKSRPELQSIEPVFTADLVIHWMHRFPTSDKESGDKYALEFFKLLVSPAGREYMATHDVSEVSRLVDSHKAANQKVGGLQNLLHAGLENTNIPKM